MTLFEILNLNKELLELLAEMGSKPDDYKYISLYKEYEKMRNTGDKVTYCVTVLSARMVSVNVRCTRLSDVLKRSVCITQYECAIFFVFMGE